MFLVGKGGQSHILRGSKGLGVTIESYGKVEISFRPGRILSDNFKSEVRQNSVSDLRV
jgi:pantoate kinase